MPNAINHQLTSDVDATLATLEDVDEAAILPSPPAISAAGQSEQNTVYAKEGAMLDVDNDGDGARMEVSA